MLHFVKSLPSSFAAHDMVAFIAPESFFKASIQNKVFTASQQNLLRSSLKDPHVSSKGLSIQTLTGEEHPKKILAAILPAKLSRHNSPTRNELVFHVARPIGSSKKPLIVVGLDSPDHAWAIARSLTRLYTPEQMKAKPVTPPHMTVLFMDKQGKAITPPKGLNEAVEAYQWCMAMVNRAPSTLVPSAYAAEIKKLFKGNKSIKITEVVGEKLAAGQLNGIYNVGKGALDAPRMVILDYNPGKSKKCAALIGKGVTYDTGGLSLKSNMVGMRGDMGGSAAVIGAFYRLVNMDVKHRVVAIVGLAENAIGPGSFKNDDILLMHSGKTVEVNNTDAEGRLVLSDCLSYALTHYKPDLIMDAATLTGAQLVATGMLHAGIVSNEEDLETLAVKVGRRSGDLVHPLLFAPELFQDEFSSDLADMKNSVKNRANAQSSCAAQFIYSHIESHDCPWLHIDLAGPAATSSNLGTGYGINLMTDVVIEYL